MTKPFSIPVLLRKIKILLKRTSYLKSDLYYQGELIYDFAGKTLTIHGEKVKLTATETRLLEYFLQNRGQVLTREQILEKVWDNYESFVDERTLNVNVKRLREKIGDDPKKPIYISTVFGFGYKWKDE